MADVDRLVRLQRAHHARYLAIQAATAELVGEAWDRFAGLDDAALRAFSAAAAVIVDNSKEHVATVTTGYMAANDVIVVGTPAPIVPATPIIRNGVPTAEVYARSIIEARVRVSRGATFDEAMFTGRARATGTALTDVTLANKAVIDNATPLRPWVVGYRRVLTGKSCALCAVASTQRYRRAELMPIHQRCDCDVGEIYGRSDPGRIVNRDLYRDLKAEGVITDIGEQRRAPASAPTPGGRAASFQVDENGNIVKADGTPVRVRTEQNPEVGPVLVAA